MTVLFQKILPSSTKQSPVKFNPETLPSKSNVKSHMQNSAFISHWDINPEHVRIKIGNKGWGGIWLQIILYSL